MARYRVAFAVLAAVFVFAMIGGVFGRSVLATDDRLSQQYRIFTTALAAVEQNSIEKRSEEHTSELQSHARKA
jgi:hypothetical protein